MITDSDMSKKKKNGEWKISRKRIKWKKVVVNQLVFQTNMLILLLGYFSLNFFCFVLKLIWFQVFTGTYEMTHIFN